MTYVASARLRLVSVYGAAHALVDASCAATVFYASATARITTSTAIAAVLLYNLLAFASQPLLGWYLTDLAPARNWARVGAMTTAAAFFVSQFPAGFWCAVALAGLGNAVFHVGGGVISLRIEPGKASLPGVFVAPGAAGLALGMWMGANQWLPWLPALALALTAPFLQDARSVAADQRTDRRLRGAPWLALVAGLLFVVVAIRAFVGSGLMLPWKSQPVLLWTLTAAVVLGKACGGVLADRFGRVRVGVSALALSAPLLVVGPSLAGLGIVGMFLLNMTMPVTLSALADALPERPGFAFGLTCLALILGSLPLTLHLVVGVDARAVGLLAVLSAILLWIGLRERAGTFASAAPDTVLREVS